MEQARNSGYNRGLNIFARLTAGATFFLLIAGGLVTSNDAGLAVPDWPLSYGSLMPPMVGGILYEHGHRMVATFVGVLTIVLAVWLWRREPRRWLRRLGWVALAAVIAQGVLGGMTVLFLLPRPVSIAHASLAQLFFCLTVSVAVFTGPTWRKNEGRAQHDGSSSLPELSLVTALAVFFQLILGAAFRHNTISIIPHLLGAALVTVFVLKSFRQVRREHNTQPVLRKPATVLAALLAVQLLLGASAYLSLVMTVDASQPLLPMVVLTVAHLAVGALLLATCVVLMLHAHRLLVQPQEAGPLLQTQEKAAA
jgi:cytochrome c oxidase assembly protein subunit 15